MLINFTCQGSLERYLSKHVSHSPLGFILREILVKIDDGPFYFNQSIFVFYVTDWYRRSMICEYVSMHLLGGILSFVKYLSVTEVLDFTEKDNHTIIIECPLSLFNVK